MNDLKHISLNEYEQVPPENVWLGLCAALDQIEASEKKFQKVVEYEVLPDPAIWLAISNSLETQKIPDASAYPIKIATVNIKRDKQSVPPSFSLTRAIVYIAVAASLVVGFFTVYQATKQQDNEPIIVSNNKNNPSTQPATPQLALPDTATIAVAGPETNTKHSNRRNPIKKVVKKEVKEGFVSNNIFEIEDEDSFFLTLANYVLPTNSKGGNNRVSIKVDQYSSLYISSKMSIFMRGLYERSGKKNKPTRKARRSYRALRSWKKASNKAFGEAHMQDVSNPFVLAEFLYKNR